MRGRPAHLPTLQRSVDNLLQSSLAVSTSSSYKSAWSLFSDFARESGFLPSAASPGDVLRFIAFLAQPFPSGAPGLAQGSVRAYVAAIRFHLLRTGVPATATQDPRVRLALRGLKRTHGQPRVFKRPLTVSLIRYIYYTINQQSLPDLVFWAALCIGVHGQFRPSEILPKFGLRWDAVRLILKGNAISITLARSKTDPFGNGTDRIVIATRDSFRCPVHALIRVAQAQGAKSNDSRVFATSRSSFLTTKKFAERLQVAIEATHAMYPNMGFDATDFSGKSMRRHVDGYSRRPRGHHSAHRPLAQRCLPTLH